MTIIVIKLEGEFFSGFFFSEPSQESLYTNRLTGYLQICQFTTFRFYILTASEFTVLSILLWIRIAPSPESQFIRVMKNINLE